MKKSKIGGRCKTCLGCNKLDEIGFKGTNYCKYYQSDRSDKYKTFFYILIEILILIALGYLVFLKVSRVIE